jgi:hypothetical protein
MRKIYLSLLAVCLLNVIFSLACAQSIPPTNGAGLLCANCVPAGWIKEDGWPAQVSHLHFGPSNNWVPATPFPPSGKGVGGSIFMGLQTRLVNHDAKISTSITGLVPGKGYKFTYYVISAKTNDSDYGEDIRVILEQDAGPQTYLSQLTEFSAASNNLDKWIKRELVFIASGTTASLTVMGAAKSDFYEFETVAIDIDVDAIQPCDAGTAQVTLSKQVASTTCPTNKFDLTSLVVGQTPADIQVMWFTNPNHTGFKYLTPQAAAPGTYYAFFYDTVNHCYNTDNSTAVVTVTGMLCGPCNAGSNQATLSTNKIKNICPATLVDLKPLVTNVAPPGSTIVFYSTPNHAPGTMIPEVQMTGKIYVFASGTYYAFFYDQVNECFNTDNSTAAVTVTITPCPAPCNAGTEQVSLHGAFEDNICPSNKVDITKAIAGVPPQGTSVVWFTNPNHTGLPYPNPTFAEAGSYYAFFYDAVNDCYNTDNSSAKVTAIVNPCPLPCNAGTKQATLSSSKLNTGCPAQKVDLTKAFTGAVPDGTSLVWFTNPTHSGLPYPTPNTATAGTYYAFFYDAVNDCYNTNNSTAMLIVTNVICPPCNATTDQVVLSAKTIKNVCPSKVVNLKPLYENAVPNGATLVFYSTPDHQPGTVVPEVVINGQGKINVSVSGVYYAFFFDQINSCFNTDYSTGQVTVTIDDCSASCNAGTEQVGLLTGTLNNTCPATTVALSNALNGINYPPLAQVVWFTNPNHSGNPYPTPQQAIAGDYYAFFYDMPNDCYNTDNATAKVTVTINPCAEKVELSVKVNLQGAMHANLPQMRNGLQTYDGVGLLPQTDPYGSGVTVPGINNLGATGTVVDWIKVEVRSAANPANILESQSLILRPNGDITNADLSVPKFTPQAEPVRIVIKHRNHLAIMSNVINTFAAGMIDYDFRTSLSQAFNEPGGLPQMVMKNGTWCMWAGDVNASQDFAIDVTDYNQEYISNEAAPYSVYLKTDLDMNGALDATDLNILYFNNTVAPYSVIQN